MKVREGQIENLLERVRADSCDLNLRVELAKSLVESKQYRASVEHLQIALASPKRRSEVLALLTECYYYLGAIESAIESREQLRFGDPSVRLAIDEKLTIE